MSVYRHTTADWGEILIEDGRDGRVFAKITDQRASGYHSITLPADERQAAAQALAGDEYGVVPAAEAAAPDGALSLIADVIGTDDLGEVLPAVEGLKEREKEAHHLKRANDALCRQNEQLRAEVTALREREAQPDRPEPVDPASVKVGDFVEIEAHDGEWLMRGWVRGRGDLGFTIEAGGDEFGFAVGAGDVVRVLHRAETEPIDAMDAAVIDTDAGDDTLREQLADVAAEHRWMTTVWRCQCEPRSTQHDYSEDTLRRHAEHIADALLPLIREHVAAAVQAERERAAVAVEELPGPNGEGVAKWPKQHADVYMLAIEEAAAHIRALNDREADDDRR